MPGQSPTDRIRVVAAGCRVVKLRADVRQAVAAARGAGKSIGLVPTMGALHPGHLSLVEAARRECDITVVTIFVNPTQFGPGEDFQKYPRTFDADLERLAPLDVDLVFAPPVEEIYRPGHATYVELSGVAEPLEGRCRPGHFRGVATVVLKLFNIVAPDTAYFGQKDFQQSLVIRRLVEDLDLDVRVRVCPIVREPDGLALSSRNVYLNADAHRRALALVYSLAAACDLFAAGERRTAPILARMHDVLARSGDVHVDYAALCDPDTLADVQDVTQYTVALVAARVGGVRLIDNCFLGERPVPAARS